MASLGRFALTQKSTGFQKATQLVKGSLPGLKSLRGALLALYPERLALDPWGLLGLSNSPGPGAPTPGRQRPLGLLCPHPGNTHSWLLPAVTQPAGRHSQQDVSRGGFRERYWRPSLSLGREGSAPAVLVMVGPGAPWSALEKKAEWFSRAGAGRRGSRHAPQARAHICCWRCRKLGHFGC